MVVYNLNIFIVIALPITFFIMEGLWLDEDSTCFNLIVCSNFSSIPVTILADADILTHYQKCSCRKDIFA